MLRKHLLKTAVAVLTSAGIVGSLAALSAQQGPQEYPDGTPVGTRPRQVPLNLHRPNMIMVPPPEGGVAIRAGRMFDANAGTNLTNQVILIQGERITEVGPAAKVQIPAGARVIDLSNATVLPGLIDAHGHWTESGPNTTLAAYIQLNNVLVTMREGWTTLVDMGWA